MSPGGGKCENTALGGRFPGSVGRKARSNPEKKKDSFDKFCERALIIIELRLSTQLFMMVR